MAANPTPASGGHRPSIETPAVPAPRQAWRYALRGCLSRFATGVAVVSFDSGGSRYGLTINAFTSVSMEPPLVLVSVAKSARAHQALRGSSFCVNVLGAEQNPLARHFAGTGGAMPVWREGGLAPRLAGTLATLECGPWAEYGAGDHTLFIGEVHDFDYRSGDALAYANSRFSTLEEPVLGHEYII